MRNIIDLFKLIGFKEILPTEFIWNDYNLLIINDIILLRKILKNYGNKSITAFYPIDYSDINIDRTILLIKNYFPCLDRKLKIKLLLSQNYERNI